MKAEGTVGAPTCSDMKPWHEHDAERDAVQRKTNESTRSQLPALERRTLIHGS
jgi:hypothetical protein